MLHRRHLVAGPVAMSLVALGALAGAVATTSAAAQGAPAQPFVSREVLGRWTPFVDATGTAWGARSGVIGPPAGTTRLVGTDVKGTTNDALYQVSATKLTGYTLAVPHAGRYAVRLLMAEGYFTRAGGRVFDVTAEGSTALHNVDIVGDAGFATAYDRTFEVAVNDGRLDLQFVATTDVAMIAAIEVTEAPAAAAASPGGERAVQFAPSSFWYADVRNAPLAANSAAIAADLDSQVSARYNGVAAFNVWQYNLTYYRVRPGTPRIDVGFWNCQNQASYGPYLTAEGGPFVGVPMPSEAVGAVGTDGAASVYDPATDQLWEFWKLRRNATTGAFEACWGGRVDAVASNPGHFQGTFGVSAAGIALIPGVVTLADVQRGVINHAVHLSVPESQWSTFSWPAQRSDGTSENPNGVMQGQRLRLDPSVDVNSLGLTPIGRMVALAAQRYGFVVGDTSGAVTVATESGLPAQLATGVDPWVAQLAGTPSYLVLKNFPWDHLQALAKDYGKPAAPTATAGTPSQAVSGSVSARRTEPGDSRVPSASVMAPRATARAPTITASPSVGPADVPRMPKVAWCSSVTPAPRRHV